MRPSVLLPVVLSILSLSGCGLLESKAPRQNPGEIVAMTRNMYIGTEIDLQNLDVQAMADMFVKTNFPERAHAIAEEIAATNPDVVALQEVALIRIRKPSNPLLQALEVKFDFLGLLLQALALKNRQYVVAAKVNNFDLQFQANLDPEGLVDLRVTDRDVILVRKGVAVSLVAARNFTASRLITLPLNGQETTIPVPRGYLVIDGAVLGTSFRFVNTHLENDDDPAVQAAQAQELLDTLQRLQATDTRPLIVAGDFNSPAPPAVPVGSVYQQMLEAGFEDHSPEGFTCCFPPNLLGPTAVLTERIDFIFTRSLNGGPQLALLSSRLVGNQVGDQTWIFDLWPSDHAGVVARFKLLPNPADTVFAKAR